MKPSQSEINKAMSLMQELFENDFIEAISYKENEFGSDRLGFYDWKKEHHDLIRKKGLHMDRGETKACIWHDEDGWVIKVGMRRETNSWYRDHDSTDDFCELEEENYKKACDCGVGEFFAAIYKIGEISGVSIFLQEFAQPAEEEISDRFYDYASRKYGSDCECDDDLDRVWVLFGVDGQGLREFIMENDINDLHEGNWGYTIDDRLVCFDYSGYVG